MSVEQEKQLTDFFIKDFRREHRRQKRVTQRDATRQCFNCRETGHDVRACPQVRRDSEQGMGICFKCGSTEHAVQQCTTRVPPGHYPFAKCFICKETGHLSRACPDNPRGMYPNGGCCNECGSVEHFRKDCPELQRRQMAAAGAGGVSLSLERRTDSADAEDSLEKPAKRPAKPAGPKVVKF